ncbi:unnamed protein product [Agarophyton chilense]
MHTLTMSVLCAERLHMKETVALAALLYTLDGAYGLKALIVEVMRVRHGDHKELDGMCVATRRSVSASFSCTPRYNQVYEHIAEPHDDMQSCNLLTARLSIRLHERYRIRVEFKTGMRFARDGPELQKIFDNGEPMMVMHARHTSARLHAWVRLWRGFVKLPALSSAEKFANVVGGDGAQIYIASTLQSCYMEKMAATAKALRYDAYVIVTGRQNDITGVDLGAFPHTVLPCGSREGSGASTRRQVRFRARSAQRKECPPRRVQRAAGDKRRFEFKSTGGTAKMSTACLTGALQPRGRL